MSKKSLQKKDTPQASEKSLQKKDTSQASKKPLQKKKDTSQASKKSLQKGDISLTSNNSLQKIEVEILPDAYKDLLKSVKEKIVFSQVRAVIAINEELIKLYWEIGNTLYQKQKKEGWGTKATEKLANDLKASFPTMKGFSVRNLQFMTQFAREFSDFEFVTQLVSQIPWGHIILIMQRLMTVEEKRWYVQKTIENGWSRSVLETWIDSNLYERQGQAITNFTKTLPSPQSDLAHQTFKDPYVFDFLTMREKFDERELEQGLLDHIQKFLLELGAGFAFLGRQFHLEVGGQDFYLDLLFYHIKLRCFVIIDLKARELSPKDTGQMNFYLSAVDDLLKGPHDNPTIGLLLCKENNKVVAEYSLRNIDKPIGIAQYELQLLKTLPRNLKGSLPSIEEIEQEFVKQKK